MKIPILIVMLLSLTSATSKKMWKTRYFTKHVVQQQDTWCVHACMEMSFGIPQCMALHRWLEYSQQLIFPTLNCCDLITPDNYCNCVEHGGVARSEISSFLRQQFSPISGVFTDLWDFLPRGDIVQLAFLSVRYTSTYHLVVLREVEQVEDYLWDILYCDPEVGYSTRVYNPNKLEIIY